MLEVASFAPGPWRKETLQSLSNPSGGTLSAPVKDILQTTGVCSLYGKSIHNQLQWIERLWRDVFQGALKFYYGLFYHLESMGALDPNSDIHLFCLHYVYAPRRINQHLSMWKDAWNMHPLRTESNHTPLQLWTRGLLARSAQDVRDMDDELLDEVVFYLHVNVCMNCVCHLHVYISSVDFRKSVPYCGKVDRVWSIEYIWALSLGSLLAVLRHFVWFKCDNTIHYLAIVYSACSGTRLVYLIDQTLPSFRVGVTSPVTFFFQALFSTYGVDWDGPPPADDDNTVVVVPQTDSPFSPTKLAELHALYDPLSCSDNFSVNLYFDVKQYNIITPFNTAWYWIQNLMCLSSMGIIIHFVYVCGS